VHGTRPTVIVDRGQIAAALPGYELGAKLGSGAFGLVLAARHRELNRPVAVKIVPAGPGSAAEAQLLASLDHPHIVRVHDCVEAGELRLVVMELLGGGTLTRRRKGIPPEGACAAGLAVAAALSYAHARGVLHRDVKTDNMLFDEVGLLKVTDFGIAKIMEGSATTASAVVGTPAYMAPEQILGGRLGPATDLYALGVVLYQLLTGAPLFDPTLPIQVLWQHHLNTAPAPPAGAPAPVAGVVLAALAKEPTARPPSAHAFAIDLAAAAARSYGPRWTARSGIVLRLDDDVRDAAGDHLPASAPPAPAAGKTPLTSRADLRKPPTSREKAEEGEDVLLGSGNRAAEPEDPPTARHLAADSHPDQLRAVVAEAMPPTLAERPTAQQPAAPSTAHPPPAPPQAVASPAADDAATAETAQNVSAHIDAVPERAGQSDAVPAATADAAPTEPPPTPRAADATQRRPIPARRPDATPPAGGRQRWAFADGARRRRLLAAFTVVVALSVTFSLLLLPADREGPETVSRRLAAEALRIWDDDQQELARRLAVAAYRTAPTIEARASVHTLLPVPEKPLAILTGHTGRVDDVAFSPDGALLATAGWDGTARLWDAASRGTVDPLATFTRSTDYVAFSPDGSRLATAGWDGTARLWDATGRGNIDTPLAALSGNTDGINGVVFSPDGALLATASEHGTARLWDATGRGTVHTPLATLSGYADWVNVAFSPDGALLATAGWDGTTRLWDATSRGNIDTPLATLTGHTDGINDVVFSPDGTLLATAGVDKAARLWDATSRGTVTPLAAMTGHIGPVDYVVFSPDGTLLATASVDGTTRLWDATSRGTVGTSLATTRNGDIGPIGGVLFSPDGSLLATAGKDDTVRLWDTVWLRDVDAGQLVDAACVDPANRLTAEQWAGYVPDLSYYPPCD
jgi:WD40 repeat protein